MAVVSLHKYQTFIHTNSYGYKQSQDTSHQITHIHIACLLAKGNIIYTCALFMASFRTLSEHCEPNILSYICTILGYIYLNLTHKQQGTQDALCRNARKQAEQESQVLILILQSDRYTCKMQIKWMHSVTYSGFISTSFCASVKRRNLTQSIAKTSPYLSQVCLLFYLLIPSPCNILL